MADLPLGPSTVSTPLDRSRPWYRELTRYHWFVLMVAALGWLFDCLDQQLFALARVPAMKELLAGSGHNTNEFGGYATSIFLMGWASGGIIFGLSAIDIALWDIAGKVVNKPVHQLLGGSDATSLRCYASLVRYGDPERVKENVRRAVESGYRHLKLHEVNVECVRAAREAAGDDIEITLDVNCPWSAREALDMTEKLRPFNLRWLEEPVWPPENYLGLARVRQEGGIPVAAGENASTLMDFQHLIEAKAVDFIQPSPAKMGGLTELKKVFALANANNVTVMVHSFYDGPGLLASVHASAALTGPGALVEWRFLDLEAQIYGDAIIPKNGAITVPHGPGLGLEPQEDVIHEYRVA